MAGVAEPWQASPGSFAERKNLDPTLGFINTEECAWRIVRSRANL